MKDQNRRLLEIAAMREAERKEINRLTNGTNSLSSSMSSIGSLSIGPGRVRKMFADRRNNGIPLSLSPKGFDKSYPLDPVKRVGTMGTKNKATRSLSREKNLSVKGKPTQQAKAKSTPVPLNRSLNSQNLAPRGLKKPLHHKSTPSLLNLEAKTTKIPVSNAQFNRNKVLPNSKSQAQDFGSNFKRNQSKESLNNFIPKSKSLNFRQVNASKTEEKNPSTFSTGVRNFLGKLGLSKSKAESNFVQATKSKGYRNPPKQNKPLAFTPKQLSKSPPPRAPTPPGLESCKICKRHFNPDRLATHESICAKTQAKSKKRKVYDPTKMRTEGTDAEKYIKRGDHLKTNKKTKKVDWRKKHEDFISTIRAAKGVKGYEAPPIDISDYVHCPHCDRNFSEEAAGRHIPKCANIISNKSNRNGQRRR